MFNCRCHSHWNDFLLRFSLSEVDCEKSEADRRRRKDASEIQVGHMTNFSNPYSDGVATMIFHHINELAAEKIFDPAYYRALVWFRERLKCRLGLD